MAFHTLNINNSFFELAPFKVKSPVTESNGNYFIPFLSGNPGPLNITDTTGLQDVNPSNIYIAGNAIKGVGGKFYYNPSSNILTVGNVKITGTNSSTATIKSDAATNMYVDIGGNVPLVINYDSTDKFIACGSSFSNLVNLGTSARKWASVYATTFHGDLSGTATNANKVYINNSTGNGGFPLIFTNIARCGTPGHDALYTDTANDLNYNPSTNTLKGGKLLHLIDSEGTAGKGAGIWLQRGGQNDGTYDWQMWVNSGSLTFSYNNVSWHDVFYSDGKNFTMNSGSIITPTNDNEGILPATNNYGQIGSESKKFYRMYASTFYGNLTGNATSATTATSTTNVIVSAATANATYYVSFVNGTSGARIPYTDAGLYYNPSTNELSAGGGFYERSDERLKDFQEDIEVNLSYLHNIPKKYYSWKDDVTYTKHIGTSAQEVQKYYPELVNSDENGYLTMNYDKLSVVALKAIDILHEEVTELKKENAELKERLSRLEELILNK